jgi:hypothetical protein
MIYELDHAKDSMSGSRYFIVHGPIPKGINDHYGYPICDSMNRHHCISPEEDDANGELIVRALNCHNELLAALKAIMAEGWGKDDTMDHMPGIKQARLAIANAERR